MRIVTYNGSSHAKIESSVSLSLAFFKSNCFQFILFQISNPIEITSLFFTTILSHTCTHIVCRHDISVSYTILYYIECKLTHMQRYPWKQHHCTLCRSAKVHHIYMVHTYSNTLLQIPDCYSCHSLSSIFRFKCHLLASYSIMFKAGASHISVVRYCLKLHLLSMYIECVFYIYAYVTMTIRPFDSSSPLDTARHFWHAVLTICLLYIM